MNFEVNLGLAERLFILSFVNFCHLLSFVINSGLKDGFPYKISKFQFFVMVLSNTKVETKEGFADTLSIFQLLNE